MAYKTISFNITTELEDRLRNAYDNVLSFGLLDMSKLLRTIIELHLDHREQKGGSSERTNDKV